MIILLSPSKTINPKEFSGQTTVPIFVDRAETLVAVAKDLGENLASVFGVSEKIAQTNRQQYSEWNREGTGPAAWAYRGETFAGLSIEKLNKDQQAFAQQHVRIVSGLYGLLRPLDSISPYRLEMSTKLKGEWGNNLYEFWSSDLAESIRQESPDFILNCASNEYSKAVEKHLPKDITVVTPKFLHEGRAKMSFAKYTRGLMARWAIENQISKAEDVVNFDSEGYTFDTSSDPLRPVFNAPKDFSLKGRWTKT